MEIMMQVWWRMRKALWRFLESVGQCVLGAGLSSIFPDGKRWSTRMRLVISKLLLCVSCGVMCFAFDI